MHESLGVGGGNIIDFLNSSFYFMSFLNFLQLECMTFIVKIIFFKMQA